MSFALKRNNFRVQIRRENLNKILQTKKQHFFAQKNVNQAIDQILETHHIQKIPSICALKFNFIEQQKKHELIKLIIQDIIEIDITKPNNISLITKLSLTEPSLISKYFSKITEFAEKLSYTLTANREAYKELQDEQFRNSNPNLVNDIIFFPNCLLEFWAQFFQLNIELTIRQFCTILKSFTAWFNPNNVLNYQNFNKYSLCYFMYKFMPHIVMFTLQPNEAAMKQFYQFGNKYRMISMSLILRLMQDNYYSSQMILMLKIILESPRLLLDLRNSINAKQLQNKFFILLLNGLQNENYHLKKSDHFKDRFIYNINLTQQQLKILQQLSLQQVYTQDIKNIHNQIWQSKMDMLNILNQFITIQSYQNLVWKIDIQQFWVKLLKVYVYSISQNDITSQVQKSIANILYNYFVIMQQYFQRDPQQRIQSCIILTQNYQDIQLKLRKCISDHKNLISLMISQTRTTHYDHVRDFLQALRQMSQFVRERQIDREIVINGRLIQKVCNGYKESEYSQTQGCAIMSQLMQFLGDILDQGFEFNQVSNQVYELKGAYYEQYRQPWDEQVLDLIINTLENKVSSDLNI